MKPPARLGTDSLYLALREDCDGWNRAGGAGRFVASTPGHDEALFPITKHHSDLSSLENAECLLASPSRRVLRKG